jgi:hypothetical protein
MCLACRHFDVWKRVDRREKQIWANWRMQFQVIGKFKWSLKLIFFCLCMSSTLHKYINVHDFKGCGWHAVISTFGNASIDGKDRFDELDNVICKRMCRAYPHFEVWRYVDLFIVLQGDHERLTERGQVNGKKSGVNNRVSWGRVSWGTCSMCKQT